MPKYRIEGQDPLFLSPLDGEDDMLFDMPPGELPPEPLPIDDIFFGPGGGLGGDLPPLPLD